MNWTQIRSNFPAVERCVYLNTAAGGAMSRQAAEEAKTYYDEMTAVGDRKWNAWLERTEETRRQTASFLSAKPEEIAFLSNTSAGLNVVADLLDEEGEVLALAEEYPSVCLPWLHRKQRVRFLPTQDDGGIDIDDFDRAAGPNTRIAAISHVQYCTGFRCDLEELGKLCRSRGWRLVVDATQSFGTFPIDIQASQADAFIFSGYKWVTAGYGIATVFVRKDVLEEKGLPAVGWRSAKKPYALINDRLDLTTEARGLELGHPTFPGIFAQRGALRALGEIGLENIEARIDTLTDYLLERMDGMGIAILSPRERGRRAGITMIGVPDPIETAQRLEEKNVSVSARGRGIRVALHFYNNRRDIDRLAEALGEILKN
jgi:selenocysteine lyase/cysteine desulfurase